MNKLDEIKIRELKAIIQAGLGNRGIKDPLSYSLDNFVENCRSPEFVSRLLEELVIKARNYSSKLDDPRDASLLIMGYYEGLLKGVDLVMDLAISGELDYLSQ